MNTLGDSLIPSIIGEGFLLCPLLCRAARGGPRTESTLQMSLPIDQSPPHPQDFTCRKEPHNQETTRPCCQAGTDELPWGGYSVTWETAVNAEKLVAGEEAGSGHLES